MDAGVKAHRIAILLKSLGDDLSSGLLQQISQERAASVSSAIHELEADPPSDDEVVEVLEEFHRFMEFALAATSLPDSNENAEEQEDLTEFLSTGDPFEDLLQLHDYQIAGALRSETGATIALVLSQLPDARIGEVVRQLPDSVREQAFLRLQAPQQIPKNLLTKVIQSTVERARHLDQSAASDPDHLAAERTASLLRAMNRKTRGEMFSALENAQPELAEQVKSLLFRFEDLLRFTDKSIQRLLGEVETTELATALKNADDAITERIVSNLSKRARATLLEEIEFLDSVSSERQEAAEKTLCDVFAQLDQAGDLEMMD